jgi:hypothetical protein
MIQSLPSGSRQFVSNHLTTDNLFKEKLHMLQKYVSILSGAQGLAKKAVDQR